MEGEGAKGSGSLVSLLVKLPPPQNRSYDSVSRSRYSDCVSEQRVLLAPWRRDFF